MKKESYIKAEIDKIQNEILPIDYVLNIINFGESRIKIKIEELPWNFHEFLGGTGKSDPLENCVEIRSSAGGKLRIIRYYEEGFMLLIQSPIDMRRYHINLKIVLHFIKNSKIGLYRSIPINTEIYLSTIIKKQNLYRYRMANIYENFMMSSDFRESEYVLLNKIQINKDTKIASVEQEIINELNKNNYGIQKLQKENE